MGLLRCTFMNGRQSHTTPCHAMPLDYGIFFMNSDSIDLLDCREPIVEPVQMIHQSPRATLANTSFLISQLKEEDFILKKGLVSLLPFFHTSQCCQNPGPSYRFFLSSGGGACQAPRCWFLCHFSICARGTFHRCWKKQSSETLALSSLVGWTAAQ